LERVVEINLQTILTGFSTAYKITRYGYRVYLRRPALRTWRVTLRIYRALHRVYTAVYGFLHRPPTPARKAAAVAELRTALKIIDDATETNLDAVQMLGMAVKPLRRARRLDPAAEIIEETKDGKLRYDHDIIAAQMLYMQAGAHMRRAERVVQEYESGMSKDERREIKHIVRSDTRDALWAMEHCIKYQPDNLAYLNRLALAQFGKGKRVRAWLTIRKILKRDPGNVEALKLRHRVWSL
jgi:hypothetical protein